MIEKTFYEIIKEAKNGQVEIDNDKWPIAFNTIIIEGNVEKVLWNDNNNITLLIKNLNKLLELLNIYVELELEKDRKTITFFSDKKKNQIKFIITYMFVNATTEDFLSPIELVERQISFLKDDTFDFLDMPLTIDMGEKFINSELSIKKSINSVSMETPNRIDLALLGRIENQECKYNFPSIYYGISNGTCYIYSVMMPKSKREVSAEEVKFNKKINRILYKINNGIKDIESQEYFDFIEGKSDYYPEDNITDVTHSFLLAINAFISLLQVKNIKNINVVTYLPIRYQSRDLAAKAKDKAQRIEFEERNNQIQTNITNKIIRTFRRLSSQNPNIAIEQLPYEVDEFLGISIEDGQLINNELLKDTNLNVKENATYVANEQKRGSL